MPKSTQRLRLGERDYDIFDHVMRYRMTTPEVLHHLFFSDSKPNAVTKVTSRLVRHGFLNRHTLYDPRTYFTLGPKAAPLLGLSPKKTVELGSQTLPQEYGILNYCCLSDVPRERLRVADIRSLYPAILHKKIDSGRYYLDRDGDNTRLAYIRVDHGGPPEHVVRRCRHDLQVRRSHPPLQKLIEEDRFLIAIITAREEKKEAIHRAIRRHGWTIRFRIEVVPDLINVLLRFSEET